MKRQNVTPAETDLRRRLANRGESKYSIITNSALPCPPLPKDTLTDDVRARLDAAIAEIESVLHDPESGQAVEMVKVVNVSAIRHRIFVAITTFITTQLLPPDMRQSLKDATSGLTVDHVTEVAELFASKGANAVEKQIVPVVEAAVEAALEQAIQRLTHDAQTAVIADDDRYTATAKSNMAQSLRAAMTQTPVDLDVDARGGRQRATREIPKDAAAVASAKQIVPKLDAFWKWVAEKIEMGDFHDIAAGVRASNYFARLPRPLQASASVVLSELKERATKSGRAIWPSTLARRHAALSTGNATLAGLNDRQLADRIAD